MRCIAAVDYTNPGSFHKALYKAGGRDPGRTGVVSNAYHRHERLALGCSNTEIKQPPITESRPFILEKNTFFAGASCLLPVQALG